jgi:hypothetical protein
MAFLALFFRGDFLPVGGDIFFALASFSAALEALFTSIEKSSANSPLG